MRARSLEIVVNTSQASSSELGSIVRVRGSRSAIFDRQEITVSIDKDG
jgi:hypothetical protein